MQQFPLQMHLQRHCVSQFISLHAGCGVLAAVRFNFNHMVQGAA